MSFKSRVAYVMVAYNREKSENIFKDRLDYIIDINLLSLKYLTGCFL